MLQEFLGGGSLDHNSGLSVGQKQLHVGSEMFFVFSGLCLHDVSDEGTGRHLVTGAPFLCGAS